MGEAMADVFISYARKDAARVDRLVAALESDGFDVWIDRKDLRPGHRFFLEIEKEFFHVVSAGRKKMCADFWRRSACADPPKCPWQWD